MRRVACYAAHSTLTAEENREAALDKIDGLFRNWISEKGSITPGEGLEHVRLEGGDSATLTTNVWSIDGGKLTEYRFTQPNEGGQFMTRMLIGGEGDRLGLFLELRASGPPLTLKPLRVDARCPEIYRRILRERSWFLGPTPALGAPTEFRGTEHGRNFVQILNHPDRNVPLIAISVVEGKQMHQGPAASLAADVAGVGIVATLDEEASWYVTNELGREWACCDRAIRLYWPVSGEHRAASSHPFWSADAVVQQAGSTSSASMRLRNRLRRDLLALSTYTINEPALLTDIETRATREKIEKLRVNAAEKGDWVRYAEELGADNTRLRNQNVELTERVSELEAKVAGLGEALRYKDSPTTAEDLQPEHSVSVETLDGAVLTAADRFHDTLIFGLDSYEGPSNMSADAGPPEKVFAYLETLAEMTRIRRSSQLGKDMLKWLSEHGVRASDESDSTLRNTAAMRKRTWRDDSGQAREFSLHLKPNDGTSPDRCVRIYFDYDEERRMTLVGWVGRHPD